MVVVEALAGHAMAEVGRIAERAVGLPEIVERRPFGQVAVAGVHADHSVGDSSQELDRVVTGDDRVRGSYCTPK